MEKVEEILGDERNKWERIVLFDSLGLPYHMLRINAGKTDGIVCIGFSDNVLWLGRIWGRQICTYKFWRTLIELGRKRGCTAIVGRDDKDGEPFYRAARFIKETTGKYAGDWVRKI